MNELAMIDQNIVWFFFLTWFRLIRSCKHRQIERERVRKSKIHPTRDRDLWKSCGWSMVRVLLSLPHWLAIRVHIFFIHLYFFFFFLNLYREHERYTSILNSWSLMGLEEWGLVHMCNAHCEFNVLTTHERAEKRNTIILLIISFVLN